MEAFGHASMLLKNNQRPSGGQFVARFLKTEHNEHVQFHELRSFMSDDFKSAFREAYAASREI